MKRAAVSSPDARRRLVFGPRLRREAAMHESRPNAVALCSSLVSPYLLRGDREWSAVGRGTFLLCTARPRR